MGWPLIIILAVGAGIAAAWVLVELGAAYTNADLGNFLKTALIASGGLPGVIIYWWLK